MVDERGGEGAGRTKPEGLIFTVSGKEDKLIKKAKKNDQSSTQTRGME